MAGVTKLNADGSRADIRAGKGGLGEWIRGYLDGILLARVWKQICRLLLLLEELNFDGCAIIELRRQTLTVAIDAIMNLKNICHPLYVLLLWIALREEDGGRKTLSGPCLERSEQSC